MTINLIAALLAMAFFTLLERKVLGYIQLRKGPNKVSLAGIPQPLADALKLFTKEQTKPTMSNLTPFFCAPLFSLILALTLWFLYVSPFSSLITMFSALLFLTISSLNVYTTLMAGWASNSKYSLLGAIRSIAQTISYEVSMALIMLAPMILMHSMNFSLMILYPKLIPLFLILPLFLLWFTTMLAETNRSPFDFAEGESELVSGFNTEYSAGPFSLIFMAEYMNILIMSLISIILFFPALLLIPLFLAPLTFSLKTMLLAFTFIWIRGSYPRMRYDQLMALTWKTFLPLTLAMLIMLIPLTFLI